MKHVYVAIAVWLGFFLAVSELPSADGVTGPAPASSVPVDNEERPPARMLVWSNPGTSGIVFDSANWTEFASAEDYQAGQDGRPATRMPDENTDIVLPDAPDGRPYVVGYTVLPRKRVDGLDHPQWSCRHVTIGAGAGLDGGCSSSRGRPSYSATPVYDTPVGIYGNVVVKDGGYIYGPHVFLGARDTFVEIGNSPEPVGKSWTVRKTRDASVTLLARTYDLAGGLTITSGRFVLQSGSHLRFGAGYDARLAMKKLGGLGEVPEQGYIHVDKDGALELGPGSRIGRAVAPEHVVADFRIEGRLQIGTPGGKNEEPAVIELAMAEGDVGFLTRPGGLYIRPTAEVRNFGKLTITGCDGGGDIAAAEGVAIILEKAVDLGDVSVDYLSPGGIAATDLQTAKSAVNKATFGQHCAANGDDLFSKFDVINFQGGWGTVEFVDGLTTDCKILFPHAGRLMVRSQGNRTLQSFDLKSIHAVTIDGRRTEFQAKRPLNDQEQQLRQLNALWGDVPGPGQVGKYGDHQWPDGRVMIWARPGESGLRFIGPNWLDENGMPYFEVPLISQRAVRSDNPPIDMLLPAADTPYVASGRGGCGNEGAPPHRHLTIEYNASYGSTYNVQGNLWMKHGSGLSGWHRGRFGTEQPNIHRFLRFDGQRIPYRRGDITAPLVDSRDAVLGQWGHFAAGDGSTLELIGRIRAAADRLYIDGTGTLIISEDSELADGARAGVWVMPDATLVLLQDARIGSEVTMQHPQCYASIMVSGTLLIGLPDKPIRQDMLFPLSGVKREIINRSPGVDMRSAGSSFVLSPQGRFAIHSADPQNARVVFTMHDSERARAAGARYARDGQPEGIVCYFAGQTEIDGILFDKCYAGGIIASPAARLDWKNVFYGGHNLGEPDELHWELKLDDVR